MKDYRVEGFGECGMLEQRERQLAHNHVGLEAEPIEAKCAQAGQFFALNLACAQSGNYRMKEAQQNALVFEQLVFFLQVRQNFSLKHKIRF